MSSRSIVSRRRVLATVGVVGLGAVVAACGAAATPTPAPEKPAETAPPAPTAAKPTAAPAAAKTTAAPAAAKPTAAPAATKPASAAKQIKYQQRAAAVEDFVRKKYAPEFEQTTGTKVVIEDIPNNEYFQKIAVLAAANQLGDLAFGFTFPWLANWASKSILRPIDAEVKSAGIDLGGFYKGVIGACTFEGKLYGLPTAGHPAAINLYFNQNLLQQAGIALPDSKSPDDAWTWDDILSNAKTLTVETGGKKQWGYMHASDFILYTMSNIRPFGAELYEDGGSKALVDSPQGIAAYTYYHGLIYKDKVAPSPADLGQGVDAQSLFVNGELAMFTRATSEITTLDGQIKGAFEWGVFPMPPGPAGSRGATTFANTTSVTSQAKEVAAAVDFLKLISSHEAGVEKLLMNSGSPGMRPDVFQDPRLNEKYPWFKIGHNVMLESKAPPIPTNVRLAELQAAVPQVESEIWLNQLDGEAGAKKLAASLDEILRQPR